ncbi:MAG: prolyl oligopeptidase family serine peptidase [Thermoanaerobaculia bacterium]|nr:prolyl oligopeptidase family serine peptidase [Thermoanaerobaculia bacterium]
MRSTSSASSKVRQALVGLVALLLPLACRPDPTSSEVEVRVSAQPNPHVGRYRLTDDLVLEVSLRATGQQEGAGDELVVLPSFWRSRIPLELDPESDDPAKFRSLLHPEMKFHFERDGSGSASRVRLSGHRELVGVAERLPPDQRLAVELLLAGDGVASFQALEAAGRPTSDLAGRAIAIAQKHLNYFPSRADTSVAFARALAERLPENAEAQATLGLALVQADRRAEALPAFRTALRLKPDHELAQMAMDHLFANPREDSAPVPGEGKMSFSLDQLFVPPSPSEIQRVRERWASRDLSSKGMGVEVVRRTSFVRGSSAFDVVVLSHTIAGALHYGAVFVPSGAPPGCCPVVVDVRGVSWDYAPLDLSRGTQAMEVLREDSDRFVFVVPSLRGETLQIDADSYTSEGDRRDGWDGGADAVIAFLDAALQAIPEANPGRVCVFGKSRGGSVALLAAARDDRFDCVVDWAGPADWFTSMGSFGWSLQELVAVGIEHGWKPGQGWGSAGQFIERLLQDPIDDGTPGLEETRLRMLASSPLYFVDLLPPADMHYGVDDGSVGRANGLALEERLDASHADHPDRLVTIHDGAGHDMPWPEAYDASRDFLLRHLEP